MYGFGKGVPFIVYDKKRHLKFIWTKSVVKKYFCMFSKLCRVHTQFVHPGVHFVINYLTISV